MALFTDSLLFQFLTNNGVILMNDGSGIFIFLISVNIIFIF